MGVICKQKYLRDVRAVQSTNNEDSPHCVLEKEFNEILKQTLNVTILVTKYNRIVNQAFLLTGIPRLLATMGAHGVAHESFPKECIGT